MMNCQITEYCQSKSDKNVTIHLYSQYSPNTDKDVGACEYFKVVLIKKTNKTF